MSRAVIFYVDGTLVDSVDLHARAWQEAFRKFGREIEFGKVRQQIGKGGDQLMPVFFSNGATISSVSATGSGPLFMTQSRTSPLGFEPAVALPLLLSSSPPHALSGTPRASTSAATAIKFFLI